MPKNSDLTDCTMRRAPIRVSSVVCRNRMAR